MIRRLACLWLWCLISCLDATIADAAVDFDALRNTAPEERLERSLEFFASLGSRVSGYDGAEKAAHHIQKEFRDIGLKGITVQEYDVSIPLEQGGLLKIVDQDEGFPLHGLWPNLVKTSTLPEGGMRGRIIDAGSGEFSDMDGQEIDDAIILMDFNSGDNWLNSAYLGASAVLFVEPDSTVYLEGEKKFLTMPLDIPRFWISKSNGESLREAIAASGPVEVQMEYRMDWERRPAWNIFATIPGYDPLLRNEVIVLESYYDAMSVVPALAPGAEQASGITALLELARYFQANPPARSVIFLATSAHHLGLRGIDDFIQRYLRKEDPFVDHMLIRRTVEAALAQGRIDQDGVYYRVGREEFLGKEALVRSAATDRDTALVAEVLNASLEEGIVRREGGRLLFLKDSFATQEDLLEELIGDEDLKLDLYRTWVDPKVDSLDIKLFVSLDLSSQTDELGVWNSNTSFYYKRYFAPFGKNFIGYARLISRELGYNPKDVLINGISPEGGMSWETFVPDH